MASEPIPTLFAPAERSSDETFQLQLEHFQQNTALHLAADASPNILLVLNQTTCSHSKAPERISSRISGIRSGKDFNERHFPIKRSAWL